jgi:hypothetical protein
MFEELLVRIAGALKAVDIPYMIIGGQAVLLYGTPRLTKDIDITLGVSTERLDDVTAMSDAIGLKILPEDYRPFVEKTWVLPAKDPGSGIRVDFIFSFTPYERQAIGRANPISLQDTPVLFASVEDVIIHKVFAGRARDLEDVCSIILKNPRFDREYVTKWLEEFDRSVEGGGFLDKFNEISGAQPA